MPLTRAQLVLRAREQANAVGSTKDWPPDLVLLYADAVLAAEYDAILFAVPHWRTATRQVTLGASRRVALAALDAEGGADTPAARQVTHRVMQVAVDGSRLRYVDPWNADLTGGALASGYWTLDNDEVLVGGAGSALTALVAHRPPLATELQDESVVTLPAGYDLVVVLMLAAELLGKAGRDTQQALELEMRAETKRAPLLARLGAQFGGPREWGAPDDAGDYYGMGG